MKIKIKLFERGVDVVSDDGTRLVVGGGIDELLSLAQKYDTMIERAEIEGDCQSYTFKRQVFLFANLINFVKGEERQTFPKYQYDQKISS